MNGDEIRKKESEHRIAVLATTAGIISAMTTLYFIGDIWALVIGVPIVFVVILLAIYLLRKE